ncbi:MAG: T9SS type A sorting domain-containing protein [Dinghuibacter sp.]|nr:T9SS type A sorting domain-containing protein [Dinghuibacter sp.]
MRSRTLSKLLFLPVMIFCLAIAHGQQLVRPADRVRDAKQRQLIFSPVATKAYIIPAASVAGVAVKREVTDFAAFEVNNMVQQMAGAANGAMELTLPMPGGSTITLELVETNIYTPGYVTRINDGQLFTGSTAKHYQGIVKNKPNSVAAISILEGEIAGFFSKEDGNYVVGRTEKLFESQHAVNVVYKEAQLVNKLLAREAFSGSSPASPVNEGISLEAVTLTSKCVRVYIENDYDVYLWKGSIAAVQAYASGLFNQVQALFSNDGIKMALAGIQIFTTPTFYSGATDFGPVIQDFNKRPPNFPIHHDVGMAIIRRLLGIGSAPEAGQFKGLCSNNAGGKTVYVSNVGDYLNLPSYSKTVHAATRGIGHMLGSEYTRDCKWNGNNTPIDGCAKPFVVAGENLNCPPIPPIPSGGGTIMSFCNLTSVGVNFSLGFGPQPAARIRAYVEGASCLGTTCLEPCYPPLNPSTSNILSTSANISWTANGSALNYTYEYKKTTSTTWTTGGTITGTSATLTGLTSLTGYDWRVRTNCPGTNNSSSYVQAQFTTLNTANCATPTGAAATSNNSCGFSTIYWNPVPGALSYRLEYKIRGTTNWLVWETAYTNTVYTFLATTDLPGGFHDWRVAANCAGGMSPYATGIFRNYVCPESVSAKPVTGSEENNFNNSLSIFPQPASGTLNIHFRSASRAKEKIMIRLFDVHGRSVLEKPVAANYGNNNVQLDINRIPPALYILKLNINGKEVLRKVQVK